MCLERGEGRGEWGRGVVVGNLGVIYTLVLPGLSHRDLGDRTLGSAIFSGLCPHRSRVATRRQEFTRLTLNVQCTNVVILAGGLKIDRTLFNANAWFCVNLFLWYIGLYGLFLCRAICTREHIPIG